MASAVSQVWSYRNPDRVFVAAQPQSGLIDVGSLDPFSHRVAQADLALARVDQVEQDRGALAPGPNRGFTTPPCSQAGTDLVEGSIGVVTGGGEEIEQVDRAKSNRV